MAVSFVNATIANVTAANATPALPTGWAADDLLIALCSVDANTTYTTPSGWTLAHTNTQTGSQSVSTFYKKAASGEVATQFAHAGGSVAFTVILLAYRGQDLTTPMDATAVAQANASSLNITAPSITTVTANAWVVWFGAVDSSTFTVTKPTSATNRLQGTTGYRATAGDYIQASPGATGTQAGTVGTARANAGVQVAIRPAGAGGGASHPLDTAITGGSTVAVAGLTLTHPLATAISGGSTVAVTRLILTHPLATAITGGSTFAATSLALTHPLTTGISGGSTVAATRLTLTHPLVTAITGGSSVAADLTAGAQSHALTTSITGGSTVSVSRLVLTHPLATAISGGSAVSVTGLRLSHPLSTSIAGGSTVSADIAAQLALRSYRVRSTYVGI